MLFIFLTPLLIYCLQVLGCTWKCGSCLKWWKHLLLFVAGTDCTITGGWHRDQSNYLINENLSRGNKTKIFVSIYK